MFNQEEKQILRKFFVHHLGVNKQDNWATVVDWLREVERENKEYFLEEFPECDAEYELIAKMITDEQFTQALSDADALIQRSFIVIRSGNENVQQEQNKRVCDQIIKIIELLTKFI